ncbi:L-threonylcarbamoyladenylate synthase [Chloroflexota bacterium]
MLNSLDKQVELAIDVLKNGGIIAFPTDTVYGLGASCWNEKAVAQVYRVKKRPRSLAFPLLIADKSEFMKIAAAVPEIALRLAERFMPGGLTLVLKGGGVVSSMITAGGDTVAMRVPNHPIPIALIRGLGAPLIGTSANLSGGSSPTTAQEVYEQLGQEVDFIIDGGKCPGGIESTIIDISSETPVIIREGAISRQDIEDVCGFSVSVL